MNLKHLQTFVTLSEVKSFTKAARSEERRVGKECRL